MGPARVPQAGAIESICLMGGAQGLGYPGQQAPLTHKMSFLGRGTYWPEPEQIPARVPAVKRNYSYLACPSLTIGTVARFWLSLNR